MSKLAYSFSDKGFVLDFRACTAAAVRVGVTVSYMTDPDWLYHVASLSMSCIAEMICILLVYNLPGIPVAFRESTLLSRVFSSLRSSVRSTKRLGRSGASGSDNAKTGSKGDGHYNHMDEYGLSMDDYQQHMLGRSISKDQLRGTNQQFTHLSHVTTGDQTSEDPHTTPEVMRKH